MLNNEMDSHKFSDQAIALEALKSLAWNCSAPKGIRVIVKKGWVTLEGQTQWNHKKTAAQNAVSKLNGVRGVTNDIVLKSEILTDDLKRRIEQALK